MNATPRAASPESGPPDYLLIGHVTVDRLDEKQRPALGGTATYAALTLRNLGVRTAIHTSATYEPGLVDTLYGTLIARIPAEYTTCFVNQYDALGQRQQRLESVAEKLTYEQILPEWRHAAVVHLAPLCQEVDAAIVGRFPKSLVGVTPQGWLRAWGEDGVIRPAPWSDAERVLARADAVVISEQDVADPAQIEAWARVARLLVVTLADRGCRVYKQGEADPYLSPAYKPAREVDPTGAGDVFAAAYFWHLHSSGGNWREAADWANCVASFAVEKRGTQGVPKLEEIEKRWRSGARLGAPGPAHLHSG